MSLAGRLWPAAHRDVRCHEARKSNFMRWQVRRASGLVGVRCHYDSQLEISPRIGTSRGCMAEDISEQVGNIDGALVISSKKVIDSDRKRGSIQVLKLNA